MTIQIELGADMGELLGIRARLQGLPVEDYAHQLLQEALTLSPAKGERATPEEFRALLNAMGTSSEGTKLAAGQTYDREFIYGDHP